MQRKFIKKLFDDNTILGYDAKISINNGEFIFDEANIYNIWEFFDIAVRCAIGGEDFYEETFQLGDYSDRLKIVFKGGCNNSWYMEIDYISEKVKGFYKKTGLDYREVETGFYYIETLDLVMNLLEVVDRSYKEIHHMYKEIQGDNRMDYLKQHEHYIKNTVWRDFYEPEETDYDAPEDLIIFEPSEYNVELKQEDFDKQKKFLQHIMQDKEILSKSDEEIAEKKSKIIKDLWFWHQKDKRFEGIPTRIYNLEPKVDLHANDNGEYPELGSKFIFIGDGDKPAAEIEY